MKFLGSVLGASGQRTYLFKDLANNQILTLTLGAPSGPWTLTQAQDEGFTLNGPGGTYAVNR